MAQHAGATVFAVLLSEPLSPEAQAPITRLLGRAGADKVLLGEAAGFGAPALDATHGPALHTITERIAPMMVLFPAGGPGPELGAALAMRLSGVFGGCSDLVLCHDDEPLPEGTGRVVLRRWRATHSGYRHLDPVEIERPVVAILGATGQFTETGDGDVEVEILACAPPTRSAVTELQSEPDEFATLELARTLVIVSDDATPVTAALLLPVASPALAVVDAQKVRPAALAFAAPGALLFVGAEATWAFGSPGTRVGVVTTNGKMLVATSAPTVVDAVWVAGTEPGAAPVARDLITALAALGAARTERAPS